MSGQACVQASEGTPADLLAYARAVDAAAREGGLVDVTVHAQRGARAWCVIVHLGRSASPEAAAVAERALKVCSPLAPAWYVEALEKARERG